MAEQQPPTGRGLLDSRAALVTAAGSGIGLGIATRFVAEGARVLLADVDGAKAEAAARGLGPLARALAADARNEEQQRRMVAAAVEHGGDRLDVAVNAVGFNRFGFILEQDVEDWRYVLDICLTTTFLGIKHQAPAMRDGGSIVNIASLNALQPAEGTAAYCTAKAGVSMLTQVAAMELGPRGIRVNAIGPGLIETPRTHEVIFKHPGLVEAFVQQTTLGRYGLPADVAGVALFLASDDSAWMTGQTLYIDGGASMRSFPDRASFEQARRGAE
jgi:3-oxoacyl-[acyl-carrier protein] reductase